MACRNMLAGPFPPLRFNRPFYCKFPTIRVPQFPSAQRPLCCSSNGTPSSSSSQDDQGPPQEAVLKAISDDATIEWLVLDQKVHSYPTVRRFTAIGTGVDNFVQAMVVAVESVIQQPIPEGRVRLKVSSWGKYVSVNIGPVRVISSEQVQAVYNAMKRDDRMKYFL